MDSGLFHLPGHNFPITRQTTSQGAGNLDQFGTRHAREEGGGGGGGRGGGGGGGGGGLLKHVGPEDYNHAQLMDSILRETMPRQQDKNNREDAEARNRTR
eukprot:749796-Hanusia_phi.AAC.2